MLLPGVRNVNRLDVRTRGILVPASIEQEVRVFSSRVVNARTHLMLRIGVRRPAPPEFCMSPHPDD